MYLCNGRDTTNHQTDKQGGSRIFGGGRKSLCGRTQILSEKPNVPYGRGPLKGPEDNDALLWYLSLIFKYSDTKWEEKNTVDPILGGWGRLLRPL